MLRIIIAMIILCGCVTRPGSIDFRNLDQGVTSLAFTASLSAKEESCFITFYNDSKKQFIQIEVFKSTKVYAVAVKPGIYRISELDCDQNFFFWKSDARLLDKIYVKPGAINYIGNLELEMKQYEVSGIPDQYSIGLSFSEGTHQLFIDEIPKEMQKIIYWGFSGKPLSRERPNNRI